MGEQIECRFSSGERPQAPAEFLGVSIRNKSLDFLVSALPDWKRFGKHVASIVCKFQDAGSPIGLVS